MFVLQNASVLYFESLRMIFPQKSCSSLDGFLILFEIFQSCMKNYFQFILDWRQKTVNLLTNLPIQSSLISYPRFLSASISTFPILDIKNIGMKRGFGTKQIESKIIYLLHKSILLTHFIPLVSFFTPWKHSPWCFPRALKEINAMA